MITNKSHVIFAIPNMVTVCRIVLTPFFVLLLLNNEVIIALFVFSVASISDALDGFIARYYNQRTVLGTYLDPVADKLLLISAFICLSLIQCVIPNWLTCIVIGREFLIVIGFIILLITDRSYRTSPSLLSKFNTVIQIMIVFESLLISGESEFSNLHNSLCWFGAFLTLTSGLQYVYIWFNLLRGINRKLTIDR